METENVQGTYFYVVDDLTLSKLRTISNENADLIKKLYRESSGKYSDKERKKMVNRSDELDEEEIKCLKNCKSLFTIMGADIESEEYSEQEEFFDFIEELLDNDEENEIYQNLCNCFIKVSDLKSIPLNNYTNKENAKKLKEVFDIAYKEKMNIWTHSR